MNDYKKPAKDLVIGDIVIFNYDETKYLNTFLGYPKKYFATIIDIFTVDDYVYDIVTIEFGLMFLGKSDHVEIVSL